MLKFCVCKNFILSLFVNYDWKYVNTEKMIVTKKYFIKHFMGIELKEVIQMMFYNF